MTEPSIAHREKGNTRRILAALIQGEEQEDFTTGPILLCEIFSRDDSEINPMAGMAYQVRLSAVTGLHADELIAESPWHHDAYHTRCFWKSYSGEDCPMSRPEIATEAYRASLDSLERLEEGEGARQ